MRIVFFDWDHGGHHALYLRRFVEVFQGRAHVLVAAPEETIAHLDDLPIQKIDLGAPRPPFAAKNPFGSQRRRTLQREARLLERVARDSRADHVVHVYADSVLPYLVRQSRLPKPLSVLLFYPRAHYPSAFGTHLTLSELVRAWGRETVVAAWRRRPDAHALLTLDEEAARRWGSRRGAPAFWVPEPPVSAPPIGIAPGQKSGCVVYGALEERKGIDLLSRAISLEPTSVSITIAGEPIPSFVPTLKKYAGEMRRSGATVEVLAFRLTEMEGLGLLAQAKCVVLPYPRHVGMSRVLLEACSVGTPVIVHDRGLLGYLVRRHNIGRAVDCCDPRALRRAIVDLTSNDLSEAYRAPLAEFTRRYSAERFEQAVLAPFAASTPRTSRVEAAFESEH